MNGGFRRILAVSAVLAGLFFPSGHSVAQDAPTEAEPDFGLKSGQQTLRLPEALAGGECLAPDCLLYLPEGYGQSKTAWPIVMFLHGVGERGVKVEQIKKHGLPKLAERRAFPFVMVSPQCRPGSRWVAADLHALLKHVEGMLRIDPKRRYITGLSMGGFGTWSLIQEYPETFAAALPICGGATGEGAEKIRNLPIWAFHGEADQTVPLARIQPMVDKLRALNATGFRFTTYPGCGHDAWTRTYENPEIYTWLLAQSR